MKTIFTMLLGVLIVFAFSSSSPAVSFSSYDGNLSGFNAAISGYNATVLTFEELSDGTFLTDQYASEGVMFSSRPATHDWSGVSSQYLTIRQGNNSLSDSNPIDTRGVGVPWDDLSLSQFTSTFSSPVSFLGGYFIDNRSIIDVALYGTNGLLATLSLSPSSESGSSAGWWGVVAGDQLITEAVFTASLSGDFFAFDNFTFQAEPTQTPEPSTMFLLGSGFIGLLGFRKRLIRK